jgi:hypothetical protein
VFLVFLGLFLVGAVLLLRTIWRGLRAIFPT